MMILSKNILKNNRGSTLLGAMLALTLFGLAGAAAIQLSSQQNASTANQMTSNQALYEGNAALEYAKRQLEYGLSPDGEFSFTGGTSTITSNPETGLVTVESVYGNSRKVQSINATFSRGCVAWDLTQADTSARNIQNAKLIKSCKSEVVLNKLSIEWNWDECLDTSEDTTESQSDDPADYVDPNNPNKIIICHIPPGNPENAQTLSVAESAWYNAHQGGAGDHHEDYLGECGEAEVVEVADCVATDIDVEDYVHGSAIITDISLANTTIYDPMNGIGTPAGSGADAGEEINVSDFTMTENGTYVFQGDTTDIRFSTNHPGYGHYTLTATFADGSVITEDFIDNNISDDDDFDVTDGVINISSDVNVKIDILGSEITYGAGGPEVDVKVEMGVKEPQDDNNNITYVQLFGYRDVDGGEEYQTQAGQGVDLTMRAKASYRNYFSKTVKSTETVQVRTLVDGQAVPPLEGFGGQKPIADFLEDYIDEDGNIVLEDNQVIMLFELGTDMTQDPNNLAADFQDLVAVITMTATSGSENEDDYDNSWWWWQILKKKN